MSQQAAFTKLKEQIESAKRGLTEGASSEEVESPKNLAPASLEHDFSSPASPEIGKSEPIKESLGDLSRSESARTTVVDMVSKTARSDTPVGDYISGDSADASASEFQFFHRAKQPDGISRKSSDASSEGACDVEAEALLFERLSRRLVTIEDNLEQNHKHIRELINLLSQLDLQQKPLKRKQQPVQRLNRQYLFWLVIVFLAVGWFGLTPSGHTAIQHVLTFI